MPKRKTGLMYSSAFANYNAGNGYLCMSAGFNPYMSTNDYYDTPERVAEAYGILDKSGMLQKLVPISCASAPKEALVGFHSQEYIDRLEALSAEMGCGRSKGNSQRHARFCAEQ